MKTRADSTRIAPSPGLFLCSILLLILSFQGCSIGLSGSVAIEIASPSVTIEWEPPASYQLPPLGPYQSYLVYYRRHVNGSWALIREIPAIEGPSATILHEEIGDGMWDFAVSIYGEEEGESFLHRSTDLSTQPVGGWYLKWILSE